MKKPEAMGYQPLPAYQLGRDRSPLDRPLQRRPGAPLMMTEPQRSGELRPRPGVARVKAGTKPVAPGQPNAPLRDRERFISLPDELQGDEVVPAPPPAAIFQDLEDVQRGGVRGRITIYCVAESLNRKGLEACLRKRGGASLLHTYPDVLYGHYTGPPGSSAPIAAGAASQNNAPTVGSAPSPPPPDGLPAMPPGLTASHSSPNVPGAASLTSMPGEVFYFDYGVVACWGLTQAQERDVLRSVQPYLGDKLPASEVEMDTFQFVVTVGEKPHIQNDTITINRRLAHDHLIKMSILHALAQSTKLSVYEGRVMALVESTKDLPELLATSGKVGLSRKKVAQLIGQVFIQKSAVNLLSTVLDTPEFFWSAPDAMQALYKRVCEYVEYDNRVEVLNSRFSVLQDMLDMLRDHQNNFHTARLEWVVIWLIVIEVIVGLFECASILGWFTVDNND